MKITRRKVKCTSAKTGFYVVGKIYDLYEDEHKNFWVKGEDGMWDDPKKTLSKFVEVKD